MIKTAKHVRFMLFEIGHSASLALTWINEIAKEIY